MIQNVKEFRNLIVRYDNLTKRHIESTIVHGPYTSFHSDMTAQSLTGFGSAGTCKLCQPILERNILDCSECIYHLNNPDINNNYYCAKGPNKDTYIAFFKATNEEELLKCYKDRSKHMKNILKCYKHKILNQISQEKVNA
jgi:hypothetical protein